MNSFSSLGRRCSIFFKSDRNFFDAASNIYNFQQLLKGLVVREISEKG